MSADPTSDFFDALAARGHEPLLEKMHGSVAVELSGGGEDERWVVSVEGGAVAAEQGARDADCTLRTSKELFDHLVTGETNAMAALLRGALVIEGDLELLALFQRIFPAATARVGSEAEASQA